MSNISNTEGIQPDSLMNVGRVFADLLGKDWCADRHEIIDLINEFREHLYINPDMPNMFEHSYFCVRPCCWPLDCTCACACNDHFYGFTLPTGIEALQNVWEDKMPLKLRSHWWEGRTCRESASTGRELSVTNTGHHSPTRRPLKQVGVLDIVSDCIEDSGKEVVVRVINVYGDIEELIFKIDEIVSSEEPIMGIDSVVLPQLEGMLKFSVNDHELSTYSRYDDTVPQYRIIKVNTGMCVCNQFFVQGSQKYWPICYDTDIVEVGSRIILREAVNFLKYGREGNDPSEIARARVSENKMIKLIKGALERRRGKEKEDGNITDLVERQLLSDHGLVGYSAGRHSSGFTEQFTGR